MDQRTVLCQLTGLFWTQSPSLGPLVVAGGQVGRREEEERGGEGRRREEEERGGEGRGGEESEGEGRRGEERGGEGRRGEERGGEGRRGEERGGEGRGEEGTNREDDEMFIKLAEHIFGYTLCLSHHVSLLFIQLLSDFS